jgi:GNAT superfamily N-acetyltransferase
MTASSAFGARSHNDPVVAGIFTAAFTGDPFMAWLFRDPETHAESVSFWWHWVMISATRGASIWRVGEEAAALWQPPSMEAFVEEEPDLSAFGEMMSGLVADHLDQTLEMFRLINEGHPADPHWYLSAVGSVPHAQGRGLGAVVLRPGLEICDAEGLPAYLESSNPRNLAFYHRLGFDITGEIVSPDDEVSLTQMLREPR